ncbi:hypothetical protein TCAL_00880 [Tigriopus californicus]|uniref:glutamate--cysteine ligase n=1 Tax=Tigriopus californicus TaxID=6832 RepID=A0A553NEK0_TIGCA|nr:hypothetical protein TCAL_00880 [Tigriopus californicus]
MTRRASGLGAPPLGVHATTLTVPLAERVFSLAFNDLGASEVDMGLLALGLRTRVVILHVRESEPKAEGPTAPTLTWHLVREINHDGRIQSLAWSPMSSMLDNRLMLATGHKEVRILSLAEGDEEVRSLMGHADYVNTIAFQPESGEQIASGSDDGTLIMWNTLTGQRNHLFTMASPVMAVVWNKAEMSKIMAAQKNGQIHIFNAVTYHPIMSFDAGLGPLSAADWSIRNPMLVSAAIRSVIYVWNLSQTSQPIFKKSLLEEGVRHLKFSSRQDHLLASSGQPNYTVSVTNIRSSTAVFSSEGEPVGGLAWHPFLDVLILCRHNNRPRKRERAKAFSRAEDPMLELGRCHVHHRHRQEPKETQRTSENIPRYWEADYPIIRLLTIRSDMGLLSEGRPLEWSETQSHANHVRQHGIVQFIRMFREIEQRQGDVLKWGDEIEYNVIHLDPNQQVARVSLRAQELLRQLQEPELAGQSNLPSLWRPEYAAYMVEGTPGVPYGGSLDQFNTVEKNMNNRRNEVRALLLPQEKIYSMSIFPRLGCPPFTEPVAYPDPEKSFTKSLFWPNEATYQGHPRFRTLTRNIRERRGEKVAIHVPLFPDDRTNMTEDLDNGVDPAHAKAGHIYMDAMGFGMGLSCLQVTFQACHLDEAKVLYDQLTPVCPIFLALTASSPMFRGLLADVDCRWDIISAAVDDRKAEERDPSHPQYISKSRYASVSSYLSRCALKYPYNDIKLAHDPAVYEQLRQNGIDELMAKHISHIFVRDTVSLFSEKVDQDDSKDTDHFENIQSTNWQSMRFKPPPPNSNIGWRVEFRPCELQLTDFENAAMVCFVVLLTRAILSFNYNLLIPISLVDVNMKRAQKRDAVLNQKFFFRTNMTTTCEEHKDPVVEEMTLDEIVNGCPAKQYLGLLPIVQEYLKDQEIDSSTMCTLSNYWKLIKLRSTGALKTNAKFMRDFVLSHPNYGQDSKVSEKIQFDLLTHLDRVQTGEMKAPTLLADLRYVTAKAE